MNARKLIEFGHYRLVRVHAGFTAIERKDGSDWLGAQRWQCAAVKNEAFRSVTLTDGRKVECIDRDWVERRLNELGDAMLRAMKRGREKRGGK